MFHLGMGFVQCKPAANAPAGPTAPAQFGDLDWTFVDTGSGGTIRVGVGALPSDGGSPLTDIELRINGATVLSAGTATTGSFDLTSLPNGVEVDAEIRAVNAIDPGPWSAVKIATPTAASTAGQPIGLLLALTKAA